MSTRMQGAIRSLGKGFGFIAGDDGINYYLHWSGMRANCEDFRELQMRMRIDFEIRPAPHSDELKKPGPRAVDAFVIKHQAETIGRTA